MPHFNGPAGVAALAVSLASLLAPAEAQNALAQQAPSLPTTQAAADEIVPQFVSREVVQATPSAIAQADDGASDPPTAGSLPELVAAMSEDTELDAELTCLAGAIFFEARGEPLVGQLAVAEVIINRADSGRFPASYCGVVMQKAQFSFVKGGRMPTAPRQSDSYRKARALALIAHRGLWTTEAKDAMYFHSRHVSPRWSGRRQAAARISNHVFYR